MGSSRVVGMTYSLPGIREEGMCIREPQVLPVQDAGMGPNNNQETYMTTRLSGSSIQCGTGPVSVTGLMSGPYSPQLFKTQSGKSTCRHNVDDMPATRRDPSCWCSIKSRKDALLWHYTSKDHTATLHGQAPAHPLGCPTNTAQREKAVAKHR